jgi:cell division protein FtsQ
MRHLSRVTRRLNIGQERRVRPRWARPAATVGSVVLALAVAVGGVGYAVRSGVLEALTDELSDRLLALSAEAGLVVAEVQAEGRRHTSHEAVLSILALRVGQPILGVDVAAMKARLEALPWVHTASVARQLPDRLTIRLVERRPLALWQHEGHYRLVDREGVVIEGEHVRSFPHLPLLLGEEAPGRARELFEMLASEPDLMRRVTAAVLMGGRRWDLRLDHEVQVLLPEREPGRAWRLLAAKAREADLLARAVRVIDLREPDRLILRLEPELLPARLAGVGA